MEVGQTWLRRTALIYLQALLLVGDKRPCVSVSRERWLWLELCIVVPRTVAALCTGKCLYLDNRSSYSIKQCMHGFLRTCSVNVAQQKYKICI